MVSLSSLLSLTHLIGLALGVGSATVKLTLVLRCNSDYDFVPIYVRVAKPITRLIVLGMVLLTLSGIGWLLLAYPITPLLTVKLIFVGAVWVLGLFIDNVVEPKFLKLAPAPGDPISPEFIRIQKEHLMLEVIATLLFYIIIIMWKLV